MADAAVKKDTSAAEDLVQRVLREFQQISGERGVWESHWEEVARQVYPAYAGLFTSNGMQTPGEKRTQYLFDSTAPIALTRFAAAMESMLTPRNSRWHRLVPTNKLLKKDRQVREYFEIATDTLFQYRYSPKANFASQVHQNYLGLGSFGTGNLFIDELDSEPGLRYRAVHLGEVYFVENHQGIVDKAYRRFYMTARQMLQKWGESALPEQVKTVLDKTPYREFWIVHCVMPRNDYDPQRRDKKGMRFRSVYICGETQSFLSEGGYSTFPYAISRYTQAPGELYGRSPAMEALPAIKTLNEQKKTVLKQGHRVVDPVLLAHDDGVVDSFSLKPGAINYGAVTADGTPLVHALPSGDISIAHQMMDLERNTINEAFLVTLFQILVETPQMTATEVLERSREKGALLSPTMGRQQSEMLGPMVERELDLLSRQGLLPPMPQVLREAGGEFQIEYDSPLSRAQKAEEASGLMRTVETFLNVAAQTGNPEPLDHFNWDIIVPEVSDIQAVPVRWLNTMDKIKVIRSNRAQSVQKQQQIEAAPAQAAVMKAAMQKGGA